MENKEVIDKYELYSFSIYLYLYGFFYLFIFEQTLIKGLLINILSNFFTYYLINYNIISLIKHKYWRENLTDIAMPQLITCTTNIISYSTLNIYFIIPIDIIVYLLIRKVYKNEISYSKNLRFIACILFFISKLFF